MLYEKINMIVVDTDRNLESAEKYFTEAGHLFEVDYFSDLKKAREAIATGKVDFAVIHTGEGIEGHELSVHAWRNGVVNIMTHESEKHTHVSQFSGGDVFHTVKGPKSEPTVWKNIVESEKGLLYRMGLMENMRKLAQKKREAGEVLDLWTDFAKHEFIKGVENPENWGGWVPMLEEYRKGLFRDE